MRLILALGLCLAAACRSTAPDPSDWNAQRERYLIEMRAYLGNEFYERQDDLMEFWTLYAQVTWDGPTAEQAEHLEELEEDYGSLPFDVRQHYRDEDKTISEWEEEILRVVEALCGSQRLDAGAMIVYGEIMTSLLAPVGGANGGAAAAAGGN